MKTLNQSRRLGAFYFRMLGLYKKLWISTFKNQQFIHANHYLTCSGHYSFIHKNWKYNTNKNFWEVPRDFECSESALETTCPPTCFLCVDLSSNACTKLCLHLYFQTNIVYYTRKWSILPHTTNNSVPLKFRQNRCNFDETISIYYIWLASMLRTDWISPLIKVNISCYQYI